MKSIRSFLLSRLLGGAAVVLAGAGLVAYLIVARSLEEQFDRNLTDRVQGFASILFQTAERIEFEFSDELMPEYDDEELPAYFELWFEDGELIERSDSLGDADLSLPVPPSEAPAHWSAPLPDGRTGRYVCQLLEIHHVYPEEGPDRPQAARVVVVVARGREELLAAEREVLLLCAAMSMALIGLIAFLSWTAVGRGLEPSDRLARTLDAIQVDDLPEHLDLGELPSELAPMADKIDALIRRVDLALQRERRTTADIAHELRTPISELLTVSEVALRDGRDAVAAHKALGTTRDVAWRMGRTVTTLLKLARLEMGTERFVQEVVDLGEIVSELLRSLAASEIERGLRVESHIGPGDSVRGDPDVLRIVVSNVLSNALHYAVAGGRVECRLEAGADGAEGWRVIVENDSRGLSPEDLGALTEPFWRKDHARADRSRSGLGLALSSALAEKAGLQLGFELSGATFRAILESSSGEVTRGRPSAGEVGARVAEPRASKRA